MSDESIALGHRRIVAIAAIIGIGAAIALLALAVGGAPSPLADPLRSDIERILDSAPTRDIDQLAEELADRLSEVDPQTASTLLANIVRDRAPAARAAMRAAFDLKGVDPESVVAAALDHADSDAAREAWLLMAGLDPAGGYTARWQSAPDQVAAAMVFSAAWTNRQSAEPLLVRIREDPESLQRFGAPLLDWVESVATRPDASALPSPADGSPQNVLRLHAAARAAIRRAGDR